MNICFKILFTTVLVLVNTCLLANEYLTALTTAQTWIDKNCQPGTIAHDEAIKILREIARKPIANEEKIKNIKKEFPRAFQRDEKTLIFVPPISWHIHSLTLAYDIKDSATTRSKTVDVFQDISKFHTAYDGQRKQRAEARSSRFLFGGKINLTGSLETSLQDLSWIKASTNLSTKLSSSYISYSNAEAQLELWSRSQQAVFSRESQRITEMLKQSNIDKFHLSFTMTITNRGNETVHCDLAGAYIPVYSGDRSSNVMARPYGMSEKVLEIPPSRTKDIVFRAELNTTTAREWAAHMANNSPYIDVLNGGQLKIRTKTGKDAIAMANEHPEIISVKLNILYFKSCWDIRRQQSTGKYTTLREALDAIGTDFEIALERYGIFQYNDAGNLKTVSSVPLGGFSPEDKEFRYMAFLQIGDKVYSEVTADLLDNPLAFNCTLWIVDWDNPDDCKNIPSEMKKQIIKQLQNKNEISTNAKFRLGKIYYSFEDELNYQQAAKWYLKAAENGHAEAQKNLGDCYCSGLGVLRDYSYAVHWYRKSAEQGNADAQFSLGWCYYYGYGVDKSFKEAVKWYQKAADQGHAVAQYNLGLCYYNNVPGIVWSYKSAAFWFNKAAAQGYTMAEYVLGLCYYRGNGVEKSYLSAANWFRRAANKGHAEAQYWMGQCYYYGNGTEKDWWEAVTWYSKAAEQGHEAAKYELQYLAEQGYKVDTAKK